MKLSNLVDLGTEAEYLLFTVHAITKENTNYQQQNRELGENVAEMQAASSNSLINMMAILSVPGVLELLREDKQFMSLHAKLLEGNQ